MEISSANPVEQVVDAMQVVAQAQQQLAQIQEKLVEIQVQMHVQGLGDSVDVTR